MVVAQFRRDRALKRYANFNPGNRHAFRMLHFSLDDETVISRNILHLQIKRDNRIENKNFLNACYCKTKCLMRENIISITKQRYCSQKYSTVVGILLYRNLIESNLITISFLGINLEKIFWNNYSDRKVRFFYNCSAVFHTIAAYLICGGTETGIDCVHTTTHTVAKLQQNSGEILTTFCPAALS